MSNLKEHIRGINPNAITLSESSSIPNAPTGYSRIWFHNDGSNQSLTFNNGSNTFNIGGSSLVNNLNDLTDASIASEMDCQHFEYNGAGQWINNNTAFESDGSNNIKPCGVSNTVGGNNSTVISGTGNTANAVCATAFGVNCSATEDYSTAFGDTSNSTGLQSTSWGDNTDATNTNSTSFGTTTTASGTNSTAFGAGTTASNSQSTSWGTTTNSSGVISTAFGNSCNASGGATTAFGSSNNAGGQNATAFGQSCQAQVFNSTAFGNTCIAGGTQSTSFGNNNTVSSVNSVCAGGSSNTIQSGTDNSGIFGGTSNTIQTGAERSVILGCTNITATNSDTTYLFNLNANGTSIIIPNLPTYANSGAASTLPFGTLYKTPTGSVNISYNRYYNTIMADNPSIYYRFEDPAGSTTAFDSSGNSNHGTIVNTVTFEQSSETANMGNSINVDNDEVANGIHGINVPNPSITDFSVELWFYPNTTNIIDNAFLWKRALNTGFIFESSGAYLKASVSGNSFNSTGSLTTNTWHYFVLTYEYSTGLVNTFINGNHQVVNRNHAINYPFAASTLGYYGVNNRKGFKGNIDEFAIYPTVLTPVQVLAHYNSRFQ